MTNVFVIDDSVVARKLLSGAIAAAEPEWNIVQAVDGAEALRLADEVRPDLAIIDFNMPGMDGLRLGETLRDRFPGVRIGILTANIQESLRRKVTESGFCFMGKPITPEKLREFLSQMTA